MIRTVPLSELLEGTGPRGQLQQGWSPQCLKTPAPDDAWGVLKTTAIQAGEFLPQENKELPDHFEPRPELEVRTGDLLLTCAGPRSRCGVPTLVRTTRPRVMLSGKMYRFRTKPNLLDPRYLELYLLSPDAQARIDRMKTGISDSGLNLTKQRFLDLPVPVVPLADQRRIVDILEDHLSRLDAANAYLDGAASRTDALSESALRNSPELTDCPTVPLARLLAAPLTNGRSVPTRAGGFPVLRLTALRGDRIDPSESKPGAWTAADAQRFLVRRGDVFVSRGNGSLALVGRAAALREEPAPVAFPDTMIRVRPDTTQVVPEYLVTVWNSRVVRRQIEETARTTAGIYKVNQGDLSRVEIPLPSPADQEAVLARATRLNESANTVDQALGAARRRSARLRQALLVAAFSGRLTGSRFDLDLPEEVAFA